MPPPISRSPLRMLQVAELAVVTFEAQLAPFVGIEMTRITSIWMFQGCWMIFSNLITALRRARARGPSCDGRQ